MPNSQIDYEKLFMCGSCGNIRSLVYFPNSICPKCGRDDKLNNQVLRKNFKHDISKTK